MLFYIALLLPAVTFPAANFIGGTASVQAFPLQDAVIVIGSDLECLLGEKISDLSVVSILNGKPYAIPFQFDEVREGKHVFEWVSDLGKRKGLFTEDIDKGIMDIDDELVLMACDLGTKAEKDIGIPARRKVEVAVTDHLSDMTRYVYILSGATIASSNVDYVNLRVEGPRYFIDAKTYRYSSLHEMGYFDELRVLESTGEFSDNLVIRNRTPGYGRLRLLGIGMEFDFYDLIRGENIARKDGPVRVLWRCAGGADFGILKINAKGSTEQAYYPNRMDQPVLMELPFNFDSILQSFTMNGTLLLNPESLPLRYYDLSHREGVRIDGIPDKASCVGCEPRDWCAICSESLCVYFLALFSDDWIPSLERTSFIEDSVTRSEVGSKFGEMVHVLRKGLQEYMVRFYMLPQGFDWNNTYMLPEIAGRTLSVSSEEINN